jgi:hypothetical protein
MSVEVQASPNQNQEALEWISNDSELAVLSL